MRKQRVLKFHEVTVFCFTRYSASLRSGTFTSGFHTKLCAAFRCSPDKCNKSRPPSPHSVHRPASALLCHKYKSWNSSLCNCSQFIVTSPCPPEGRTFSSVSDIRTSFQVVHLLWDTKYHPHIKWKGKLQYGNTVTHNILQPLLYHCCIDDNRHLNAPSDVHVVTLRHSQKSVSR